MNLQQQLNDQQYLAATHQDGPLLVLAGAGSGKTRVLTYRIAYLVEECGIAPRNILAITFTNKAAREMQERTYELLAGNTGGMWIQTFHAACGRILRSYADLIGFTKNFIIYDDSEAMTVIKDCQKRLNIDEKRISAKAIRAAIAKAKDEMLAPEQYKDSVPQNDYVYRKYADVYEMYQKTLKANNAMDFDDMVLMTIQLFENNPDVLSYYQERFRYILVDEYQDTNRAQYVFVTMLAAKYHNLCVVGDDDQSIYSFRGADIRNILDFEKEYPGCRTIKLEQNYRSTQNILDAANTVISNNVSRKSKALWTAQGKGESVLHYTAEDQNDEAGFIAREIMEGVEKGGLRYQDFTILYRVNALSQASESMLMRMGIPYRVYGGLRFFDRKEIKDLTAYLRVFNNPLDEVALRRIVNVPKRGIGATSLQYAEEIAAKENQPIFNILLTAEAYPALSRAASKMTAFASWFLETMIKKDEMGISEFVEYILEESGLVAEYRNENTIEAQSRIENLMEFISVAKEFEADSRELADDTGESEPTFARFLESVVLSTDMDKQADDDNTVTLMSIHSAKGLEFPVVFVVGMEEGIFPSYRSNESPEGLDEERRLCYVANTRAKQKLYLLNAENRMLYGQTTRNLPSRFLREIPEAVLESAGGRKRARKEPVVHVISGENVGRSNRRGAYDIGSTGRAPGGTGGFGKMISSAADINQYLGQAGRRAGTAAEKSAADFSCEVGQRVSHKKFGTGTVVRIEGSGKNAKIEIAFDVCGMKRLMLAYSNLTKIE